jgi:dipeptidyl aminopeptidase/acylaminoacyl peptidase
MMVRRLAAILFLPLMLAFGSGVYLYLGTLKSKAVKQHAQLPSVITPKFVLPGTMFVVQQGRLFKLSGGGFTEIGPTGDWSQPTITPDHTQMVAVQRSALSSDLYLLDVKGSVIRRLTKDDARLLSSNHWAFYPSISPDGKSVFFGTDNPKSSSLDPGVDLSVWSMPLSGSQSQALRWTSPFWYTGGDTSPIPLSDGLLFVRHSIDNSTAVHSQIYFQSRPLAIARPLTGAPDNCGEPALSPDGTQLAMICSQAGQTTALEVAPFQGTSLGPARVLLQGGLYASPAWSPDGKGLAYYAPAGITGHFQLWYLAVTPIAPAATPRASASATPLVFPTPQPSPVQVTQGVDLTATSPPAWY